MNETVKKHGKRLSIWEGFAKEGRADSPQRDGGGIRDGLPVTAGLLSAGYTVINASWKPLYVLNQPDCQWSPDYIYDTWNPYRWESWYPKAPSFTPMQLEPTPQVIGAMVCSWEQPQDTELASLRERVAAFAVLA